MKKNFAVIDSETDPFIYGEFPEPFIWGYYDNEGFKHYDNFNDLLNDIKDLNLTVLAHNGGKFDFHFMLEDIEPFTDLLVINGRLVKFNIGNLDFRDSYTILPFPLSAYEKMEFDYNKMKKENRKKHMPEIIEYLKSDCKNLYDLVDKFYEGYGKNITVASAAMKQFQKVYEIKAPRSNKFYFESLKQFYYGGRTEAFEKGIIKEETKLIDINSAYSYAMTFNHPWGAEFYETESKKIKGENFYQLRAISKGALPFRTKSGLSFPNDNNSREYFVTGWEVLAGIETGTIEDIQIERCIEFTDSFTFTKYINKFWEIKLNSKKDTPDYIFSKLMLNSLYGKFASNPQKYNTHTIFPSEIIEYMEENFDYEFVRDIGKNSIMRKPLQESMQRYYDIATGASITGFTRAYLWKAIHEINSNIPGNKNSVVYCDTDSIIFKSRMGLQDLRDILQINFSDELGGWDLEHTFEKGGIAGKKLYAFKIKGKVKGKVKWKTASKGTILTHNQILNVCKGKKEIYEQDAPIYSINKEPSFLRREIK